MLLGVTDRLRSIFADWVGAGRGEGDLTGTEELRGRIETALDGDVGARLGLSGYEIHAGHYLHGIGRRSDGKIFVSCFPVSARDRAARIVASQQLLQDAGIDTPEVLDSEIDGTLESGFAWVALRWYEGTTPSLRDGATARRALAQLARIHRIEREVELRAGKAARVEALPVFEDFGGFAGEARGLSHTLARAGVELPLAEVAPVQEFLEAGVRAMRAFEPDLPIVLLHSDYQPANLHLTSDGRLLVLDLEGSSFGAFPLDLARAFLKFRFKVASGNLDGFELDRLLDDPALVALQEAYLEEASEEARAFWLAHGRTVLFVGYLRMVRRRAKAALNPRRYGARKRQQSLRQALRRWDQAVRYVERAP